MKKVIALLMVCGFAFAFVACGGGGAKTESTADSTAVTADSTAAPADTTKSDTTAAH